MKRKSFKGFTLVECIVSLALFAIAALTMAQIYAQVGLMNKRNHINNTSLAYQMKFVENYLAADRIELNFDMASYNSTTKKAPHLTSTHDDYITIQRKPEPSGTTYEKFSYGVDSYVLLTRNSSDAPVDASEEKSDNLRYKYFVGKKPA